MKDEDEDERKRLRVRLIKHGKELRSNMRDVIKEDDTKNKNGGK
jgi:plasmid stability protein